MSKFFNEYFDLISQGINSAEHSDLDLASEMIKKVSANGNKVIIIGNGGSAAMASHMAIDFTKAAGIRAVCFNDADLLTCFSNDYGYDSVFEKALEFYADEGDLLIAISSSGNSINIRKAADQAKKMNIEVITLSGFKSDNPLKQLGDINFWVDSMSYNIVEMTHHIWLVAIADNIIGDIYYGSS